MITLSLTGVNFCREVTNNPIPTLKHGGGSVMLDEGYFFKRNLFLVKYWAKLSAVQNTSEFDSKPSDVC